MKPKVVQFYWGTFIEGKALFVLYDDGSLWHKLCGGGSWVEISLPK